MQEIHLQFPKPGQWNEFVMTARFPDNNGFVLSLCYTQADIPADQAPALKAAVAAIAGMDEDWQAVAGLGAVQLGIPGADWRCRQLPVHRGGDPYG